MQTGEVSDGRIASEAQARGVEWGLSSQSLKDDAEYFEKARLPIVRPARQKTFLYVTEANSPYELRKKVLAAEKEAIGQLAADLIRGATQTSGGVKYTQTKILQMLADEARVITREHAARRISRQLTSMYSRYDRLCAVDSGTTTLSVGKVFEKHGREMLPDPFSRLKSLTLLTNSTDFATCLSHPKSSVQVIMLGGRLRKETHAFAGSLAKVCLEGWNLHLDASMVGCVGINVRKQFLGSPSEREFLAFMSDTFEECETKQALFERSSLRIVLMDSSKFKSDNAGPITIGHFPFAAVTGNDVDLIITDDKENAETEIEACWKNGVGVLIAECGRG